MFVYSSACLIVHIDIDIEMFLATILVFIFIFKCIFLCTLFFIFMITYDIDACLKILVLVSYSDLYLDVYNPCLNSY